MDGPGERTAEWLSREAAARRIGVSVDTIDRAANDGRLKRYRMGRAVRFKAEDVERLLTRDDRRRGEGEE